MNINASAPIDEQIDNKLAAIRETMNKEFTVSSNPYDYIKDNADFEGIIALGSDALPALHHRLSTSENNGLQEYFIAIAIERIAKVDLKQKESTHWETAHDFNEKWNQHLRSIPSSVEAIVSSNKLTPDVKIQQLIELGIPALPFILERVELGDEQIFSSVITLTQDMNIAATESISNKKEWAAKNKASFTNLKQYVLGNNSKFIQNNRASLIGIPDVHN